jgi:hypothetical protein
VDAPTAILQIAPSALPPDWPSIEAGLGLSGGSEWLKLAGPIDGLKPEPDSPTRLRVEKVRPEHAEEWARVVLRAFGMPEDLVPMFAAYIDNPAFTPFAAWDGDELVAGGNLFVCGPIASLNTASTLPSHQRLGAQSALVAARIEAAHQAAADG